MWAASMSAILSSTRKRALKQFLVGDPQSGGELACYGEKKLNRSGRVRFAERSESIRFHF